MGLWLWLWLFSLHDGAFANAWAQDGNHVDGAVVRDHNGEPGLV